jgi:lipoyl(octanoyl) transferase
MHPDWHISKEPVSYPEALAFMENRVDAIIAGEAHEYIWALEHPPLYTGGTSAKSSDLLNPSFPVYDTGRGGEYTYHGPGQRVCYVMLDLKKRNAEDVRVYVQNLEQWIIATFAEFGVEAFVRDGRIGVWVYEKDGSESKIAALGIRVRKWVTYHGICINVHPNLAHYAGIVPCGIKDYGVTSLQKMGINANLADIDKALKKTCLF